MHETEGRTLAESASTWTQVVFGGLGVSIAIAALVIAYFAWVQPHSPDNDNDTDRAAPPPSAGTGSVVPSPGDSSGARRVGLGGLTPVLGAANIHCAGDDLAIPCPSGETDDRFRKIEYDLLGRYSAMEAEIRVTKARDSETPLQLKIFTDGTEAANKVVTKEGVTRLGASLDGRQKLSIQVSCQSPGGEITLTGPTLTRS